MPRWICSNCNATMTVDQKLIGQIRACPKCQQKSEIVDSDRILQLLQEAAYESDDAETPLAENKPKFPTGESVTFWSKVILVGAAVLVLMIGIGMDSAHREGAGAVLAAGMTLLIQCFVIWPFFTLVEDTRINRRLLEQLLQRK